MSGEVQERPYDVDAVRDWLMQRAKIANDPLTRKRLEAEVRKIEAEANGEEVKHTFWSRDKRFWLAVLALGHPGRRQGHSLVAEGNR